MSNVWLLWSPTTLWWCMGTVGAYRVKTNSKRIFVKPSRTFRSIRLFHRPKLLFVVGGPLKSPTSKAGSAHIWEANQSKFIPSQSSHSISSRTDHGKSGVYLGCSIHRDEFEVGCFKRGRVSFWTCQNSSSIQPGRANAEIRTGERQVSLFQLRPLSSKCKSASWDSTRRRMRIQWSYTDGASVIEIGATFRNGCSPSGESM